MFFVFFINLLNTLKRCGYKATLFNTKQCNEKEMVNRGLFFLLDHCAPG